MKLLDKAGLEEKGIPHSAVQIWRLVKQGTFPAPIKVGSKNAWLESEIDEYIKARVAARDLASAA
jgi:prophage regulatory protein